MKRMSINELKGLTYGKVLTWGDKPIRYIARYPDKIDKNCLCLISEKDEEEELFEIMMRCDASGVAVQKPCTFDIKKWSSAGIGIIEVDNLIMFQIELAGIYRTKFNIPFVQVIGSAGKTTTKDMIGCVLNAKMPTLVGYANYNTAYGAASNILSLRDFHKAGVLEAGTKSKGYMSFTTSIIRPDIAVLTSIQRAHYVTFGSIEKIIEAKSEILDYLDEKSVFIMNGEDSNCSLFPLNKYRGRVVKYGFSDEFDLWATDIFSRDFKTFFTVRGKRLRFNCMIQTVGKYNVSNALAAICVGLELGMRPKAIRRGLANFVPMARRLKVVRGPLNTTIVDDNFNANPDSMKLFLEEVPKFSMNKPVMLVLGDMERPDDQIEQYARRVHFIIGQQIAQMNFYKFLAIGKWAEEYVKGAQSRGAPLSKMEYFETVDQAKNSFRASVIPDSVLVFKASVYVSVRDLIKTFDDF